jgi:hypothetical protein
VPVHCFLLFLCFRKATQEIFSELGKTKARPPIFPEASRSSKIRRRAAKGWPHPRVAWPSPWPRHQGVRPPGPPPDAALPPIYSPRWEKPKRPITFPQTHTASRHHCRCEIGRIQELFLAPCQRGESLLEAFSTTMVASGVMRE